MTVKRIVAGALAAACLCTVSCTKDEMSRSGKISFSVSADAAETKTSYSGEGTATTERIDWVPGDLITIYSLQATMLDGTTHKADYVVKSVETGSPANKSNATIEAVGGNGLQWGTGTHSFTALYPSKETAGYTDYEISSYNCNSNLFSFVIPSVQTLTWDGQIGYPQMRYAYMFARTTADPDDGAVNLSFKPAYTAFEFTIDSGENDSVSLTSFTLGGDLPMAGYYYCSFDTNKPNGINVTPPPANLDNATIKVDLTGKTVTKGNPLTFTVLAKPKNTNLTDLRITITGEEIGTCRLHLKGQYDNYLQFAPYKKHKITGLRLPNVLAGEGQDIIWDFEGLGEGLHWDN